MSDKITKRKRKALELTRLHVEIETSCYEFTKAAAKCKGKHMGEYVNAIIRRRMERAQERASSVVQDEKDAC